MQQNQNTEPIEIIHFEALQPMTQVPDEPTKLPEPIEFNNPLEPLEIHRDYLIESPWDPFSVIF